MTANCRAVVVGAVAQLHGILHTVMRDGALENVVDFTQDIHEVGGGLSRRGGGRA